MSQTFESNAVDVLTRVKEPDAGVSLAERTTRMRNFPDLGPPDLVNLLKYNANQKQQTIGTFIYYTGVDTTLSSAIAAHLNHLANVIGASPQVWFGKPKQWKVQKATYAVYNAFSKVDVRVTLHIPGKVETVIVDAKGEPVQETERIWLETFVSATIRALLGSKDLEDDVSPVVECCNLNPFPTVALARQFLDACETLFFEGPKLGLDVDVQIPTLVSNYLADAFLSTVELTNQHEYGLAILRRIQEKDQAAAALVSRLLLQSDREVQAINVMYDAVQTRPRDANLLMLQTEYCIEKGLLSLALECATNAVRCSPSEFKPWRALVRVYTLLGDYENALLTLNLCPMIPHRDGFHLRRVVAASADMMHLPLPVDVTLEEVTGLNVQDVTAEHDAVDPSLLGLPAASLKLTFAKAYELLTEIVHRTGWEQLLKYRAKVFVMEEEYRKDKTKAEPAPEESSVLMAFKKKRLCERWLDNLFMLLYEDLRAFKMWQAEFVHFQSQRLLYKKNTLEWELLGLIAYRLHNYKEAAGAFTNALSRRFSAKATRKLLEYYQDEKRNLTRQALLENASNIVLSPTPESSSGTPKLNGAKKPLTPHQIQKRLQTLDAKILDAVVKLAVWNHRWYREFDTYVLLALKGLVEEDGQTKIELQVAAMYGNEKNNVEALIGDMFRFLAEMGV